MPRDLEIGEIIIEGLRAFNNAQTIRFNGSHTLIYGKMGAGKSSTLYAIEWALFGDIAHIKCSESRTQAEFVNVNKIDQKMRVTLKLRGDDGNYIILREKQAKKKKSHLTFSTPTRKFSGDDAKKEIYLIFGTLDDFHRSVFLHQEAVRAILLENPEVRDSALDRLFGLERTRDLMSSMPVTKVRKEHEKLVSSKEKIEEKIKGAIQQAEIGIERAKKEALNSGLKQRDLNIQTCIKKFKKIISRISSATEASGIKKPPFSEALNEVGVSKGLKKVKAVVKTCRMQIATTSKLNELQKEWKQINEAKEKLEGTLGELKNAIKEYKKMGKKWGTIKQVEGEEEKLKGEEKGLKRKREAMDSTYKLVADGVKVFSDQKPKKCPICDTKISPKDVLSRLRKKLNKKFEEKLSKIDNRIKKIRGELLEIVDRKKIISKAIATVKEYKDAKNKSENALRKILQSKSKKIQIILKEANKKLSGLKIKETKAEKTLTEKNKILQGIEDSADICRTIVRVLEKESEYGKIKDTFANEDSQIETLKTKIAEMSTLHNSLRKISDAIATAQINLAREFIGKGEKNISNYYTRLCGHPYYNSIRIETNQRNVRGIQKNTYNIKAFNSKEMKETLVSTRFSTGQMNTVALSIFLSLSSMLDRRTKFIILDDPSQSLDIEHKKALVKVLSDLSSETQIIVSTQDDELEKAMKVGFVPKGGYNILNYKHWEREGPNIKISKAQK